MKNKKAKHSAAPRGAHKTENVFDKILNSSLLGLAVTIGISLTLLLGGTAAVFLTDDPTAFVDPLGFVALFLSTFLGGFCCSKINKRSPYLTSVICGALFVILSMLLSFALPHSLASGENIWSRLAIHALSLACFPLGAFIEKKSSSTTVHKRKRRKR